MGTVETAAQILIRPMVAHDIDAVALIENSAYFAPWPKMAFASSLGLYPAFVMVKNDAIVGYVLFSSVQNEAHILNFVIAPSVQNQGLGRRLLQFLLEYMQAFKITRVSLEVALTNDAAIRLYQSFGFKQKGVRKQYYQTAQGREDALILVYTCAQSFDKEG